MRTANTADGLRAEVRREGSGCGISGERGVGVERGGTAWPREAWPAAAGGAHVCDLCLRVPTAPGRLLDSPSRSRVEPMRRILSSRPPSAGRPREEEEGEEEQGGCRNGSSGGGVGEARPARPWLPGIRHGQETGRRGLEGGQNGAGGAWGAKNESQSPLTGVVHPSQERAERRHPARAGLRSRDARATARSSPSRRCVSRVLERLHEMRERDFRDIVRALIGSADARPRGKLRAGRNQRLFGAQPYSITDILFIFQGFAFAHASFAQSERLKQSDTQHHALRPCPPASVAWEADSNTPPWRLRGLPL